MSYAQLRLHATGYKKGRALHHVLPKGIHVCPYAHIYHVEPRERRRRLCVLVVSF